MGVVCVVIIGDAVVKFVIVLGVVVLNRVPIRDAITLSIIMGAQGLVQVAYYENFWKIQVHAHSKKLLSPLHLLSRV